MKRRRVLVLCYFFPPLGGGGVHRVLSFTRHLPDHGWDCTVVCAGPHDYWVVDPSLMPRVRPETQVVRVEGGSALAAWLRLRPRDRGRRSGGWFELLRGLSDWWMMPDSYVGWARRARVDTHRLAAGGNIDAVLSSSPPDSVQLLGLDVRRRFGLPWIADFRDPWMGLALRRPPTPWHRARHVRWERAVVEQADRVLAASRTHALQLESLLPPERAGKIVHLPNGYEPSAASRDPRASVEGEEGRFVMAFTGMLSMMSDVDVFFDALHELLARHRSARRRLRVRLMGPFEAGYADRAEALGLTGIVEFTGPRPHAEARALQQRADVLLLWQYREFPTMVPGKLYEYLESGRPIVAVLEPGTESAELVRSAGHDVVPAGQPHELLGVLERHYLAWQQSGRTAAAVPDWLEQHRRDRLAERLARQLDDIVGHAA